MSTRDRLLSYFKEKRGEWVSGESISREISISRSAVWKHVRKLREEGYVITSAPKKGYVLQRDSHRLLPGEIREGLETGVLGQKDILYFRETDSTNSRAWDLAARGAPEGTLVVAEQQTKGRGRLGRDWFSPPGGGIYLTMILRPTLSPREAPKTTLLTAVALAEALLTLTGLEVHIKWPNDILIKRKKLAGILTEISAETDAINYMIIGLGLNVNIPSFPDNLAAKTTTILMETGKPFPRVRIVREFLERFERYYEVFNRKGFGPVLTRWKEMTHMIGGRVQVETLGRHYEGVVQDIDADGVLILKDGTGKSHRIFSGDVNLS
jgi:BirA family biotin operon repressor/biotin-[acetyl-CoA-carboxylase] ligase